MASMSAAVRQRATWAGALATAVAVVTLALVGVGIAFAIADRNLDIAAQINDPPKWQTIQQTISAFIFLVPGLYLALLRPRNPFGWLLLIGALGHGLSSAGYGYVIASEIGGHHYPQPWIGALTFDWWTGAEVPVIAAIMVFYPDARRPRGWLGIAGVLCLAVTIFGFSIGPLGSFNGVAVDPNSQIGQLRNPIAWTFFERFDQGGVLWYGPPMLALSVIVILRWLRAEGEERQFLKWLVLGNLLGAVFAPLPLLGSEWFLLSVQLPSVLLMPVLVAVTLRHRYFGIEVVVQRTFVYTTLLLLVTAIYGAIVGSAALFFDGAGTAISFVAAVAVAFALAPARGRVEKVVNRVLFGRRDEPYLVLSDVGRRLESAGSEDDLLPEFVASVAGALRVPYVEVESRDSNGVVRIAHGTPTPGVERFPLLRHGQEMGSLVVGLRGGEQAFSAADRRLLEDLARHASGAVARLVLTADLRRSRERIITAREEERRRLRRDLHDGLGPVLTGAAMLIDAARQTAPRDADITDRTLSRRREPGPFRYYRRAPPGLRTPSARARSARAGRRPSRTARAFQHSDGAACVRPLPGVAGSSRSGCLPHRPRSRDQCLPPRRRVLLRRGPQARAPRPRHHSQRRRAVRQRRLGARGWAQLHRRAGSGTRGNVRSRTDPVGERSGRRDSTRGKLPVSARSWRVLVADDHPLVRGGLRALFDAIPEVELVGEASSGEEALSLAAELLPDVVLMDIQMPGMDGLETTKRMVEASPSVAVVMLTMFDDDSTVFAAMRAGARGYLLKGAEHDEVVRAVEAAGSGEAIFGKTIATRIASYFARRPAESVAPFPELTGREHEVLAHIASGDSNLAIARALGLSQKTVANHVSNILNKLQAADRAEAIVRARRAGLGD